MENLYAEACNGLRRLCPRPVPPALRGARLENLLGLDPLILSSLTGISVSEAEHLEEVLRLLFMLHEGDRCSFCGSKKVAGVYEVWDYLVDPSEGRGVARLRGLVPVCSECRMVLDYVPGYGGDKGLRKKVVKRLAKVNRVRKGVAENVLLSLAHAYKRMMTVSDWSVDLSMLAEKGFQSYFYVEGFMRGIVEGRYTIEGEMFRVPAEPLEYRHSSIRSLAREVLDSLCGMRINSTAIVHKAASLGVSAVGMNIEEYIVTLIERGVCRDPDESRQLASVQGAWVLHLSGEERARLIAHMVNYLAENEDTTWISRVETPKGRGDVVEIHVYSPSFAVEIVVRVLEEILRILGRLGIKTSTIVFKPYDPYEHTLMEIPLYLYPPAGATAAPAAT